MRKDQIIEEIERITKLLESAPTADEQQLLNKKITQLKEQLLQIDQKQVLKG